MKKDIQDFKDLIEGKKYQEAARMYFRWAYKYQGDFNSILEETNTKDSVFDILRDLPEHGEYVDQL